ncbi:MAG: type I 3-dehydroquinate dehydratase [Clostridia bacterium]|nr:type I 3-dehydroquinate dehydratase [Clostridia bacterium]
MQHKPTFLHQNKPLITCMVQAETPAVMHRLIRDAAFDGCDAYGFQMERLGKEYRTEETVRELFAAMGRKPIYATNYRIALNHGMSDEELAESDVWLCSMGATLIDFPADLFSPAPYEMTYDAQAVERQKRLAEQIHALGGEVLISSHTHKFMSAEEVLAMAREHQARGADISKIVAAANSEEEELENLRITSLLNKELDIPFLFLSSGSHNKLHRTVGPMLGACMWLTVQKHDELATGVQPTCRAIRAIADHFDY